MNEEWNIRPYLGVFPFVFKALGNNNKNERGFSNTPDKNITKYVNSQQLALVCSLITGH